MGTAAGARRQVSHRLARGGAGRVLVKSANKVLAWADAGELRRTDSVEYRGLTLPPYALRNRLCGEVFMSNDFYVQSAVLEATRLPAGLGYTKGSRIIDVGCGVARLVTGMIAEFGDEVNEVDYLGIEPNRDFYDWCRHNIERHHPNLRFTHLDVVSELYNPEGTMDGDRLQLPVDSDSVDIVYVWGVFTNIIAEHVEAYVPEFARVARDGGKVFLTAYVEEDGPLVSYNPEDYVPFDYVVPLQVVRYNKDWLFSLFSQNGLEVDDYRYHGGMFPKQSEITLTKVAPGRAL